MKKIMMALGNESLEKHLKTNLGTEYNFGPIITRKGAILPLVMQENPDILIVKESIIGELNEDMYDILFTLRTQASSVRIILLYVLDEEEINNVTKYIKMGIYDIWTKNKVHIEDIVNLVRHPKNFGDWADVVELEGVPADNSRHNQPKNLLEDNPIAATGHLKIQQERPAIDLMEPKKIPKLVTSNGYNMGRPIMPSDKERLPNRLKHPQNIKIDEEFEIIDDLETTDKNTSSYEDKPKADLFVKSAKTSKVNLEKGNLKENETKNQSNKQLTWICTCGAENTGKFCSQCGNKKIESISDNKETKKDKKATKEVQKNNLVENLETKNKIDVLKDSDKRETVRKHQPLIPQRNSEMTSSEQGDLKKRTFTIPKDISIQKSNNDLTGKTNIGESKKADLKPAKKKEIKENKKEKHEDMLIEPSSKDLNSVSNTGKVEREALVEKRNEKIEKNRETVLRNNDAKHEECDIILFTNADRNTMGHTALNTALMLAEQGNQVVYIDNMKYSSSEKLLNIISTIKLYGKYVVNDVTFKNKHACMSNLVLIQPSLDVDLFFLAKEIKKRKEARYIVLNTDINRSVENLIIIADKTFVILKQNPVQLDYLVENYGYQFKFCNGIIENYKEGLLEIKKIKEKTGIQHVIKIKDSDKINYDSLVSQIPLLYKTEGNEILFEELISFINERK